MISGIDFGTSNCSIGIWDKGKPNLILLEGDSTLLPSALHTSRLNIEIEKIDEIALVKRVGAAKSKQTSEIKKARNEGLYIKEFTAEELENMERGAMRRELAERAKKKYEGQSISEALYADTKIVFGEEAIQKHIKDPDSGYFIKSPKTFLGADIRAQHIELFSEIVTRLLAHIKNKAEHQKKQEIENIVLGRPVNFHGTRGDVGNKQALNILERSSIAAGFKNIEFMMEPIAAALDYEQCLSKDRVVLVLDTGGGTTDCSMMKVGPSYENMTNRDSSVLGYAGDRIGGMNLDMKLAIRKIMPFFGKDSIRKNGLPMPSSIYCNAVAINDVNLQKQFSSTKTEREIELFITQSEENNKINRLLTLQRGNLSYRLNRSAELAKIHLSNRDPINLPLKYIESELYIPITRNDLKESIEQELNTFVSLMKEAQKQAGVCPDVIYVTGGTAKSPIVEEWIRSHFGNIDIVVGELFGSVTSGLTTWANKIYQ